MGLDARIGSAFLSAGLGYGGSCFPKDTDSLVHTAAALGYDFALLRAVVDVNRERAGHFVAMIDQALGPLDGKVVAVLGPRLQAQHRRHARGQVARGHRGAAEGRRHRARLRPGGHAATRARLLPASVTYCESPYEAAAGADAVALVTEWNEFKFLNLERLRAAMRRPVIFDGRNLWEPERMRRLASSTTRSAASPSSRPA